MRHSESMLAAHRPTPRFVAACVRVQPALVQQSVVECGERNEVGGKFRTGGGNERGQACSQSRSSRREEALIVSRPSHRRIAEFSQSLVTSAATFYFAFIHHDDMQEQGATSVSSSCRSLVMRTFCGCFAAVVFTSTTPPEN